MHAWLIDLGVISCVDYLFLRGIHFSNPHFQSVLDVFSLYNFWEPAEDPEMEP